MLFLILIIVLVIYVFSGCNCWDMPILGGGKPPKRLWMIKLDIDKSIDFLAYMAIEFSIDCYGYRETGYEKSILENRSYKFADSININKQKVKDRIDELLEVIPKQERLSKPMIVRKLIGFHGKEVMPNDIASIVKKTTNKIEVDSNILRNEYVMTNTIKKYLHVTSHIKCDSATNKKFAASSRLPMVNTQGTFKIYLTDHQRKSPTFFLSYTCNHKGDSAYKFLNQRDKRTTTTAQADRERQCDKNIHDQVDTYISKAVKDVGIILAAKFYKMSFLTMDAFAMLFASRVFNIDTFYAKPSEPNNFFYYKARSDNEKMSIV